MVIRPILVAAASLLAACTSPLAAPPEAQGSGLAPGVSVLTPAPVRPARPLIAKLATRDVDLSIVSGADGPRFSVANREGATLATELSEGDLREQYPALFQIYRSATARRGAPYLDATLTHGAADRE